MASAGSSWPQRRENMFETVIVFFGDPLRYGYES